MTFVPLVVKIYNIKREWNIKKGKINTRSFQGIRRGRQNEQRKIKGKERYDRICQQEEDAAASEYGDARGNMAVIDQVSSHVRYCDCFQGL